MLWSRVRVRLFFLRYELRPSRRLLRLPLVLLWLWLWPLADEGDDDLAVTGGDELRIGAGDEGAGAGCWEEDDAADI